MPLSKVINLLTYVSLDFWIFILFFDVCVYCLPVLHCLDYFYFILKVSNIFCKVKGSDKKYIILKGHTAYCWFTYTTFPM